MEAPGPRGTENLLNILVMLLLTGLAAHISSCALNPPSFDEKAWRARVNSADPALLYAPHFRDGRFFNPWMPNRDRGFLRFLKWRFSSSREYTREEEEYRPALLGGAVERIRAMPGRDFILWIGHGTFLMRLNGEYWLTDPIFSERAFLPRRKTPPAVTPEALRDIAPELNVIISHNHYDHLDRKSILSLPDGAKYYVPLGLGACVRGMKRQDVTEMDWWQRIDREKGVTLVCLPAQHWSRRIGQGVNETLWASYLLITPRVTVYFGGDSGYFIGYREIGRRFPGIDYALLPTTAYHPRWFMHHAHMDIEETIDAFRDLGARFMVPHQWGTFHLGDEPVGYPILELKRSIIKRDLDPSRYIIMDIGTVHPLGK